MKIELRLKIDYDVSALTHAGLEPSPTVEATIRRELEAVLANSVDRLVENGGLSGETLATVNSWDMKVCKGCECKACMTLDEMRNPL